jgi:iron(III) transport system ATP-binding protein
VEVEASLAGSRPFRARRPPELPPGGTGLLMVRPTGITLVGTAGGEHHLAGTVADVAFRGRGYEHAIDLPGYGRLTGVFASTRAARGEAVGLRLEPEGCHLFPQPDPDQASGQSDAAGPSDAALAGGAPGASVPASSPVSPV